MSNSRDLVKHIEAINSQKQEWADQDPANRFVGMLVTVPSHWADYDIYTPEEFDRYLLEQDFVSLHKDVYGFRPGSAYTEMSDDDMQASIQSFYDTIESELEDEREYLAEMEAAENLMECWMVAPIDLEDAELQAAGTPWDDIAEDFDDVTVVKQVLH